MITLTVLLPALPLLSALLIALFWRQWGHWAGRVSVVFAILTVLIAIATLFLHVGDAQPQRISVGRAWGSLYLDALASVMAVLVAGISLVVHAYSRRYMADEPGYARFYALLDLMTVAILLMVMAGDLITLLIAWHLVGVLLYFLLGHDLSRPAAQRYAFWTFFTYRLGDLPLILATVLLYQAYGTFSLPDLFAHIAAAPDTATLLGLPLAPTVAFLVALAAFARSAQFPFHAWLPYTMEGPTPVSALMHAGIVNAGGFLINRFAPVFVHADWVLHLIFAVGLITALMGSVLMLTQNDIKKALGYSTMGQMGFMFVECGVGAFSLAIYHLIAHGLFKGTLFLSAGSKIGSARKQDGVPHDEVYTFVVERKPAGSRQPWLIAAALTLIVPFTILGLSRWVVGGDVVGQQGAIVLLFFGWVTGAQLLFVTYRMRAENPWRMMAMIIVSLAIVVAGYTLLEHTFDLFLYPDRALSAAIFQAASIPTATFEVLMGLLTVAMVAGWVAIYFGDAQGSRRSGPASNFGLSVYSLISREFYVSDMAALAAQSVLALSKRLNLWARWL